VFVICCFVFIYKTENHPKKGSTDFAAFASSALTNFWGGVPATVPRKMIVLCGGPTSNANSDWASFQSLRDSLGVEVFAYGIGQGSAQAAVLAGLASGPDHVVLFPVSLLLVNQAPLAASAVCPSNEALCPSCNGWCCCANTCCCPACTGADPCFPAICNASKPSLGCVGAPVICDDSNVCTTDSCASSTGSALCAYSPPNACNDFNDCTSDQCSPTSGCYHTPISCDDGDKKIKNLSLSQLFWFFFFSGNICTADTCLVSGGCQHTIQSAVSAGCPASDSCKSYTCEFATNSCNFTLTNCNDNNKCTTDTCNATLGGCQHTLLTPDLMQAVCGDQNACTFDSCYQNSCNYTSVTCLSSSICLQPVCLTSSGCTTVPYNSSYIQNLCEDNDSCTIEGCSNNNCTHDSAPRTNCVANSGPCFSYVCNRTTG
jgi:hypothetical protein